MPRSRINACGAVGGKHRATSGNNPVVSRAEIDGRVWDIIIGCVLKSQKIRFGTERCVRSLNGEIVALCDGESHLRVGYGGACSDKGRGLDEIKSDGRTC